MQNKPLKLLHRNHVCREYWKLFDETFLSIEVFLPFLIPSSYVLVNQIALWSGHTTLILLHCTDTENSILKSVLIHARHVPGGFSILKSV